MNTARVSLVGKVFGRLTVISEGSSPRTWVCECSCGRGDVVVHHTNLTRKEGGSRSCGCLRKEVQSMTNHTRKGRSKVRSLALSQLSLRALCEKEDVNYKQVWARMDRGHSFLDALSYCKAKGYAFKGRGELAPPFGCTEVVE